MAKQVSNSAWSLKKLIFWAISIALLSLLIVIILEKLHVIDLYKKPVVVSVSNSTVSGGPTNVIDYPITNTDASTPDTKQSGTDQPNASSSLTGVINYKSVVGENLSIRITIYQLVNNGSCNLVLARNSDQKRVTKSAEIIQNPSSATCKGFEIPISELGAGKWTISVIITSGEKTGEIKDEVTL